MLYCFLWRAGRDSKGYALRARKLADPIVFGFAERGFESRFLFGQNKKQHNQCCTVSYGAPEGTRTPDLLVRSQSLYPTELPARIWSG